MGKINSRAKGCRGEREWRDVLKSFGYEARRGQQFSAANGDPDVVCEELPIHWEVKRVEKLNLDNAMEQAERDAKEGLIPIVAHRKNDKKWKVTLSADSFFKILKGEQ